MGGVSTVSEDCMRVGGRVTCRWFGWVWLGIGRYC